MPRAATASLGIGERRSRAKGAGLEFADHRAYQPGDDIRHLDLQLHARLGEHYVRQYSVFRQLPVTVALLVVFCGGATFSAAGGIKYLRIGAMFIRSIEEMRRLVYPHAVRAARLDKVTTDIPAMKEIWSHLALAISVFLGAALLLMAGGLAFEGSLVASLAAFTNTGPLYGAGWPEGSSWPHYGNLGWPSQLVLAVTMILGRIEVLALFGAVAAIVFRRG